MPHESFDALANKHDDLVAPKPATVERDLLLDSLKSMYTNGSAAVRANEVGAVRYASEMTARYTGALALNEQGLVQPPLASEQLADINEKIEMLSVLLHANGDATGSTKQASPTDTRGHNTRDQK